MHCGGSLDSEVMQRREAACSWQRKGRKGEQAPQCLWLTSWGFACSGLVERNDLEQQCHFPPSSCSFQHCSVEKQPGEGSREMGWEFVHSVTLQLCHSPLVFQGTLWKGRPWECPHLVSTALEIFTLPGFCNCNPEYTYLGGSPMDLSGVSF